MVRFPDPDSLPRTQHEEGTVLAPRFDKNGLITALAVHAETKEVLMLAYMNAEALEKTITTKEAHYWSRSRQELWHKGATSGQVQKVVEIRVDCDQDAIQMTVMPQGNGGACHVGYRSCFFRKLEDDGTLNTTEARL